MVLLDRACVNAHERPDAIGFCYGHWSYLIECKASRADFLRDHKKISRLTGGMGQRRYYMTPVGLLRPDELPPGWGLLEAKGRRVTVVAEASDKGLDLERCKRDMALLYSVARACQLGVESTWNILNRKPEPLPEIPTTDAEIQAFERENPEPALPSSSTTQE